MCPSRSTEKIGCTAARFHDACSGMPISKPRNAANRRDRPRATARPTIRPPQMRKYGWASGENKPRATNVAPSESSLIASEK